LKLFSSKNCWYYLFFFSKVKSKLSEKKLIVGIVTIVALTCAILHMLDKPFYNFKKHVVVGFHSSASNKLGFANLTVKLLCSDDDFNGSSCILNILLNNKLMHYLYDWNLIVLYIGFAGWNFDTLLFVWSNNGFFHSYILHMGV
jgi:hypothetical protein